MHIPSRHACSVHQGRLSAGRAESASHAGVAKCASFTAAPRVRLSRNADGSPPRTPTEPARRCFTEDASPLDPHAQRLTHARHNARPSTLCCLSVSRETPTARLRTPPIAHARPRFTDDASPLNPHAQCLTHARHTAPPSTLCCLGVSPERPTALVLAHPFAPSRARSPRTLHPSTRTLSPSPTHSTPRLLQR